MIDEIPGADFEMAGADPRRVFGNPQGVLAAGLDDREKLKILNHWRSLAGGRGRGASNAGLMSEIDRAIATLTGHPPPGADGVAET